MPITQERMLKLIDAAEDYMAGLDKMANMFEAEMRAVERGEKTMRGALEQLYQACNPKFLLNTHAQSFSTIQLEARHFRKFKARNKRERIRQANRRVEDGVVPLATAPDRLQKNRVNENSLVHLMDSEELLEVDPAELIAAGEGLDEERKKQLDKEAEEMIKKMSGE